MHRFIAVASLYALVFPFCQAATTVTVSASASHAIPTSLYGQMFEDISHSGDGGLYAEMLQNRAFQKVTPNNSAALNAWHAVNGGSIKVIADSRPLSSSLPNSLQLTVPSGATGAVGFSNEGFWGINVQSSWTYKASLHYKFPVASSFAGSITVSLKSSTGTSLASASIPISGRQTTWTQVNATLTPSSTPASTSNSFFVTVDGTAASGQTINFGLLSLFPPTFNNRDNGLRVDIAETLAEMKPAFFRFPGGNNLEGQTTATRWQWNTTVGSLLDRPGRMGDWGYVNTDGLGLLEFLLFCEDLKMEPIMGVWSGYALGGTSVTGTALAPYIQQAIDQINFVIGDPADSAPAALRASLGHPEPFKLTYIEIGNEDFVGQAPSTYQSRWNSIVTKLKTTFPQLKFIATSRTTGPVLTPKPTQYDVHVYQTPNWFSTNSFIYDSFARDGTTYFEGEYAGISTNSGDIFGTPANGRLTFPTVQSAVGEGAFMTGLERNSDIVFAAAYAPLLQHVSSSQWTPNLVSFNPNTVYRSTSFFVQKLFSANLGDQYLPSTLPTPSGTLFWSVNRRTSTNEIIIKISNNAASVVSITFVLPFSVATSGTAQVLTGPATASNSPATPNAVSPSTHTIITGRTFDYNASALSVSVLTLKAQ